MSDPKSTLIPLDRTMGVESAVVEGAEMDIRKGDTGSQLDVEHEMTDS